MDMMYQWQPWVCYISLCHFHISWKDLFSWTFVNCKDKLTCHWHTLRGRGAQWWLDLIKRWALSESMKLFEPEIRYSNTAVAHWATIRTRPLLIRQCLFIRYPRRLGVTSEHRKVIIIKHVCYRRSWAPGISFLCAHVPTAPYLVYQTPAWSRKDVLLASRQRSIN